MLEAKNCYVVCDDILAFDGEGEPYRFGPFTRKHAEERLESLARPDAKCVGPHHIEEVTS